MTDVDVIVIGGGPSGLTVAAEVARTGARVLLLEKRAAGAVPRAGTLLPRPLELFDARGVADAFIRRTCEMSPHPYLGAHIWAGMHPVDWSRRDSRFGFTLLLPQHESENILRHWAAESGADLRHSAEMTRMTDKGDEVEVVWQDESAATITTTARYVVGADGGRSRTREQAGINFVGRDHTFTGLIATLKMDFPWPGGMKVARNEHGWLNSFPFGAGLTRIVMVHAEGRSARQNDPITAAELTRCITDIVGEEFNVSESVILAASRYGDAQRIAEQFRSNRVLLVGEAARVHYPASGVGMNFCIQDSFNLGWKLGAVIAGQADVALLDTYDSERRPIAEDLLESVDAQVSIQFNFTQEGGAFIRRFENLLITEPDVTARLCRELSGLETPYVTATSPHPAAGQPIPDFEMFLLDGTSVRLYELLRTMPFIVLDLSGTGELRDLDVSGIPATLVEAHAVRRPEALRAAKAVVVRPDTYVAWVGEGAIDAKDIRTVFDQLHFPR